MQDDLFGDRRKALEEEFFRKQNDALLAAMRAQSETEHARAALKNATGIDDEALLEHLVAAGMTAASLTAVALVPLLAVAWADGQIEDAERAEILRDARADDLEDPARTLLSSWLSVEPGPALFATWVEYITDLLPRLEPAARETLRKTTLARAKAIAEAAGGGPYRIGRRTGKEEQAVLRKIEVTFGPSERVT